MLSPAMETYRGNRRSMFGMVFLLILTMAGIYANFLLQSPYTLGYRLSLVVHSECLLTTFAGSWLCSSGCIPTAFRCNRLGASRTGAISVSKS